MSTSRIDQSLALARNVRVTSAALIVELTDGRSLSVPLDWFPRLKAATPVERSRWNVIGGGEGVHWPDLDEDISVESLMAGRPSGESAKSLENWLARRSPKP